PFPAVTNSVFAAVGDFNGDGKTDLAVGYGQPSGFISVLLGKGDGTFKTAVNYTAANPLFIVVDDFNRDGRTDLAVANGGTRPGYPDSTQGGISVLLGKGDGTFQDAVNYDGENGARSMAVGDFNRDGNLDLAVDHPNWVSLSGNRLSILLGKGDGT